MAHSVNKETSLAASNLLTSQEYKEQKMSSSTNAEAIAFPPLEEVPAVPSTVLDVTCMRPLNI